MEYTTVSQSLEEARAELGHSAAYRRLETLFDQGSFTELDVFAKNGGEDCEVITGYGSVAGAPAYAFSQNIEANGGAMGRAQALKIQKIYHLAEKTGLPVIGIYDSNGAHLSEGLDALSAYGELMQTANRLSGVVPQVSLVLGACAGSAALMAAAADVVIISEGAQMYLTAPSIIGGEKAGAGSAKAVCESGTAQVYAADEAQAMESARMLLSMLPSNNLSPVPAAEAAEPEEGSCVCCSVVDAGSVYKLSPDFGSAVHTALARVMGVTVGVVSTSPEEDGRLDTDACMKAARFVRFCDAFAIPVITLVDALGFARSVEAELHEGIRNAAMLSSAYAEATTPKIAVVTGKAVGPVFSVLAGRGNADAVFALPEAVISSLPSETAVSILWNDRIAAGEKRDDLIRVYEATEASALKAAQMGYVDDVVELASLRARLYVALEMLSGKRVSTLAKKHSNMPL